MRILVTGGAGYVGTELVKVLASEEQVEEVIVFDNLSRPNYNLFLGKKYDNIEKINFVEGDILDSWKLGKILKGIDVVYHLAARVTTPFANTDSHFHEQVNHWGTAEVVSAVESSQAKKFIYSSSTSVYGSSIENVTESSEPNAKTFYGISKLRGEDHVKRLFDKIDTYILRCGNVYGYSKSMRFDAVINKFMFEANFSNRVSIHGNGNQSRSFINIDLLADVMKRIILTPVPSGIYNLVERNLSVMEIVYTLKEIYPELEFILINQHLALRDLKVSAETSLKQYIGIENPVDFKTELINFKDKFAF
jgi:UDP-glucose 4-epimerase